MSPGDESGGEDDEDGDEESPPKKRAKAKPWARGTGVRGGAGAYGGLSMLERPRPSGMTRGIRRRKRIGRSRKQRASRQRASRQRRRVRSSVHAYICRTYFKFTVCRELEMRLAYLTQRSQLFLKRSPTMPQSTLRRPEAPHAAPISFFPFPHCEKKSLSSLFTLPTRHTGGHFATRKRDTEICQCWPVAPVP